jgi:hypothetical protein
MKIGKAVLDAGLAVLEDDKVFETNWHAIVQLLFATELCPAQLFRLLTFFQILKFQT